MKQLPMKRLWILVSVGLALYLVALGLQAQVRGTTYSDALRLANGRIVVCNLVSATRDQIVVETPSGAISYGRTEINGILFGSAPILGSAAASMPTSSAVCTDFDVFMTSYGENKVGVIKVIRGLTGLALADAKTLVERAPTVVMANLPRATAESAKKQFIEVGASVELRCSK